MSANVNEVPPQALPAGDIGALRRIDPKRRHQLVVTDRIEHPIDGRFHCLDVKPTTLELDKRFRRERRPGTQQVLLQRQKADGQGIVTPGGSRRPEDHLGDAGESRQSRGEEAHPSPPSRKLGQQRREGRRPRECGQQSSQMMDAIEETLTMAMVPNRTTNCEEQLVVPAFLEIVRGCHHHPQVLAAAEVLGVAEEASRYRSECDDGAKGVAIREDRAGHREKGGRRPTKQGTRRSEPPTARTGGGCPCTAENTATHRHH